MLELRKSSWKFITAGNFGVNIDVFALSGGQIVLQNPQHKTVRFDYGGGGVGVGFGVTLPKIGKVEIKHLGRSITGTAGPESFPNHGDVYETNFFKGTELKAKDFEGACMFIDGGMGMVGGFSTTILYAGIDRSKLAFAMKSPIMSLAMLNAQPNAVIYIRGPNMGLQFGAGVAGYLGYVV